MTGEMYYINPKTGEDSNGDVWNIHLAVAKAIKGTLKPFDVYQGPYIAVGSDLSIGIPPYAMPIQFPGIVRLWVDFDVVYREDIDKSYPYRPYSTRSAIYAAKQLLKMQ